LFERGVLKETKKKLFWQNFMETNALTYYQLYPYTPLPVPAAAYEASLPRRAKLFCPPFRSATFAGLYLFPPIDFSFYLTLDSLEVRAQMGNGTMHTARVTRESKVGVDDRDRTITLADLSREKYHEIQKNYDKRLSRIKSEADCVKLDASIYHNLLFLAREESPFGFWILVYLGGCIKTHETNSVLMKHPSNALMRHDFIALDGIVETGRWHGFDSIAIKPLTRNTWVDIDSRNPICQVLGYSNAITSFDMIKFDEVDDETFSQPLRWYSSEDYRKKPGKYQRELRLHLSAHSR
jgi:hypothetical protein